MGPTRRTALVLALACLASSGRAQSGAARELRAYMKTVGFSDREIADLGAGKVVARVIPEPDDNEADVLGVVRIAASEDALVAGIRRIETFRTGGAVLQIGRFATPPSVVDLDGLDVEAQDLEALSRCRIGDCDVKAGTRTLELARQVDWKAPDADARASRLIKEAIVRLVESYLAQGSAAMAVYNDNDIPESVAAEFATILRNSPNLMHYNPEFLHYLLDFPGASLPGVEDFFYWSKEKIRKPVVSVVHVCIQKVTRGADTGYFIAMKHIYDSHYFRADVEFLTLVPEGEGRSAFYLVHAIRARIDPPRKLRGMLLGKIKGAMRDALAEDLDRIRLRLESGVTSGRRP